MVYNDGCGLCFPLFRLLVLWRTETETLSKAGRERDRTLRRSRGTRGCQGRRNNPPRAPPVELRRFLLFSSGGEEEDASEVDEEGKERVEVGSSCRHLDMAGTGRNKS